MNIKIILIAFSLASSATLLPMQAALRAVARRSITVQQIRDFATKRPVLEDDTSVVFELDTIPEQPTRGPNIIDCRKTLVAELERIEAIQQQRLSLVQKCSEAGMRLSPQKRAEIMAAEQFGEQATVDDARLCHRRLPRLITYRNKMDFAAYQKKIFELLKEDTSRFCNECRNEHATGLAVILEKERQIEKQQKEVAIARARLEKKSLPAQPIKLESAALSRSLGECPHRSYRYMWTYGSGATICCDQPRSAEGLCPCEEKYVEKQIQWLMSDAPHKYR